MIGERIQYQITTLEASNAEDLCGGSIRQIFHAAWFVEGPRGLENSFDLPEVWCEESAERRILLLKRNQFVFARNW